MCKNLVVFIFLMVITLGFGDSASAQNLALIKQTDLKGNRIESFQTKAQGITQLFWNISYSLGVPISVEVGQYEDHLDEYELKFKDGTLSELLDQTVNLINRNDNLLYGDRNQYSWSLNDGVISVFPKSENRVYALQTLLETRIESFSIKENMSCGGFTQAVAETDEMINALKAQSLEFRSQQIGGFYIPQLGKQFSLAVTNVSLKSLLDKVIKESPTAGVWFIRRNSYDKSSVTFGVLAGFEIPSE